MSTATIPNTVFARPAAPRAFDFWRSRFGAQLRRAIERSGESYLVMGSRYL